MPNSHQIPNGPMTCRQCSGCTSQPLPSWPATKLPSAETISVQFHADCGTKSTILVQLRNVITSIMSYRSDVLLIN